MTMTNCWSEPRLAGTGKKLTKGQVAYMEGKTLAYMVMADVDLILDHYKQSDDVSFQRPSNYMIKHLCQKLGEMAFCKKFVLDGSCWTI